MPEPITDPVLGHLTWDREYRWWTGRADLHPGRRIGLTVEAAAGPDPAAALPAARAWVDRLRARQAEYRGWTAGQVLDTRLNKDRPMTAEQIADLIEVGELECAPDGTARVSWDDGEVLFHGHGIVTHLDPAGACVRVEIE